MGDGLALSCLTEDGESELRCPRVGGSGVGTDADPLMKVSQLTASHCSICCRTMLLSVDHSSHQPLHDQIAGQIRSAIAVGDLGEGARLAPARELASGLDVNVHTLLRAIRTLRDEGLLDVRRGRGTFVTGAAPRLGRLAEAVEQLVAEARNSGMSRQQVLELVEAKL